MPRWTEGGPLSCEATKFAVRHNVSKSVKSKELLFLVCQSALERNNCINRFGGERGAWLEVDV